MEVFCDAASVPTSQRGFWQSKNVCVRETEWKDFFAWLSGEYAHGRLYLEVCENRFAFVCVFILHGGRWRWQGCWWIV